MSSSAGGVCGYNNYGEITNCYNTGKVSGSSDVGGVCGYNFDTITNCYNTGAVSGSSSVGGVCGTNNSGTITNCYFDSKVYNGNAVGNNMGTVSENVLGKETTQFTSGEVAYLLQSGQTAVNGTIPEVWGQTLTGENKQNFPVLGGEKVYGGYINCGDTEMNYSNSSEGLREDSEHHYGTWKLSTFPGCTTNGAISKYCKYCDDCQSIEFDPIGHDYEYTELENAQHSKVCKRCSDTVTEDCTYKNGICTLCGGKQLHTITIINGSLTKGVTKHGNAVTVTADAAESGKVFAYWQDADGKILSYNAVYSFIVTSDKTITAVYSEQEIEKVGKVYINSVTEDLENHKMIVNSVADVPEGFKIVYAGLLASNEMDPGTSTDYGTVNTKVGSVFVRGMTTSKLATSLTWTKSSISYGETWYIRAYLVYEDNNGVQHTVYGELIKEIFDYQYEVSVENGTGSGTYYNGKILTISADTVDGKEFAGWLDNETNTIVSYNENYSFIVSKNRSFTAQYSEVAVEKLGTAIIENVTKDTVNNKLSFVSFCNVPEGCEIIYAGVVAKNGSDPGTETDFGTANTQTSDGTFVRGMTSTKSSARLTWTKSNVSAEDTWYVRAYLVYKNSNGETKTVFGDVTETSLGE
ncbi:MAG: hypothetical protein MR503_01920 [Oscillospiraceae bacterium]|nr:hypothetical protein [Oscillospiraceae bacterium]